MTQTPEAVKSLMITSSVRKTEMGIEVTLHSKAVNITVEIDLDEDPEFFHAMAANLVQMVTEQMAVFAEEEWVPDAD